METTKSTLVGLARLAGLGLFVAASSVPAPSHAQALSPPCPPGGFDICFPNLEAGAPSAACGASEPDEADAAEGAAAARALEAAEIGACLGDICAGVEAEPEPGFFGYCCAAGGSTRYDDFCVFVVQSACSAVADHCVDRCPSLQLLTGTVALAPPPEACFEDYPRFIASICEVDPFCCSTSWDSICASEALAANAAAL